MNADVDTVSRYQRVYDYADPYASVAWESASGHAWDRLEAIAREYDRGELTWTRAVELLDDTIREVEEAARRAPAPRRQRPALALRRRRPRPVRRGGWVAGERRKP